MYSVKEGRQDFGDRRCLLYGQHVTALGDDASLCMGDALRQLLGQLRWCHAVMFATQKRHGQTEAGQRLSVIGSAHDGASLAQGGFATHRQQHLPQAFLNGFAGFVGAKLHDALHHFGKIGLHGQHGFFTNSPTFLGLWQRRS